MTIRDLVGRWTVAGETLCALTNERHERGENVSSGCERSGAVFTGVSFHAPNKPNEKSVL
jgi:hypothetical protein